MNDRILSSTRHFCTYFDINYLPRALCLLSSLEQHCPDFTIYMLCLDDGCYEQVKALEHFRVIPVSLSELETADGELQQSEQVALCSNTTTHVAQRSSSIR